MEWLQFLASLVTRPGRALWALTAALTAAVIVAGAFVFFAPSASADLVPLIPMGAVTVAATVALAAVVTYFERRVTTLAFVPEHGQSSWSRAPQKDGSQLTQIALRGIATNTSDKPIYLADVKLIRPSGRTFVSKMILTRSQETNVYGSDNAIPPGGRAPFSAHFFVEGFIGGRGEERTIAIGVSDQFGHWHTVKFSKLPGDRVRDEE